MTVRLIETGKLPEEPLNARLLFWLPPTTSFGNMQNKHFRILSLLDMANKQILLSAHFWGESKREGVIIPDPLTQHVYANEMVIYFMRRAADELISMRWLLSTIEQGHVTPRAIKVNRIASLLNASESAKEPYLSHIDHLELLNKISNAYKHSFVLSDSVFVGRDEPSVFALDLPHNKDVSRIELHGVSLSTLVEDYTEFFKSCTSWLREYSKINLPAPVQ